MSTLSRPRRSPTPVSPHENGCLRIPASALTLPGFRAWVLSDEVPEKLHAAFINGEIYLDMSKEELETHSAVKTEISRVIANLIKASRNGRLYIDGALVTNESASLSNNPDAVFVSRAGFQKGRVRLRPGTGEADRYVEIEGTPDWVMEIVSDSSVGKDTVRLREAYHKAGIREYWLIDARGDSILFQILQWRKKEYAPAPGLKGWQESRVFSRCFRLLRQRDDLGLWEYTLEMKKR